MIPILVSVNIILSVAHVTTRVTSNLDSEVVSVIKSRLSAFELWTIGRDFPLGVCSYSFCVACVSCYHMSP